MNTFSRVILLITLTTLFLAACGSNDANSEVEEKMKNEDKIESNMDETFTDFDFINQDKESVGLDDLKGEYWIADLVFTNCTTVCIPMTGNMKRLQDEMIEEDLTNIELISFSVDPDYDTPKVLSDYADEYGADLSNWSFLTGYDFDKIKEISIKTFRSMLQEPQPGNDQVTHGTRFFLVNPEGDVIKSYDGVNRRVTEEIIDDLNKL